MLYKLDWRSYSATQFIFFKVEGYLVVSDVKQRVALKNGDIW